MPGRGAVAVWIVLAVIVGAIGAITLPSNVMALRANRVEYQAVEAINWEVVLGDTTRGSDKRRCELFKRSGTYIYPAARHKLIESANFAFQRYHDRHFCSDPKYPGGPGKPLSARMRP